jgi:hypothetical protein
MWQVKDKRALFIHVQRLPSTSGARELVTCSLVAGSRCGSFALALAEHAQARRRI